MNIPRRQFLHLLAGAALPTISHFASAQTVVPKSGTHLITLGTQSGPPPRAHRAQSSNLLTVDGTHYIVDAGDGVARRLAKAGINVRDIGTIFITHHHDDHTGGLGMLMSVAWDAQRKAPINVYGPPPTSALVKAAAQYYGISAEIRLADDDGGRTVPIAQILFGHDVGTGTVYQDKNIKVTAVENSHFAFHSGEAAGKHKSYSYRFETPDRVIVFTGDTGASNLVNEIAKGADLLLTETVSVQDRIELMTRDGRWDTMSSEQRAGFMRQATQGHLTPELIGKIASQGNVKTVVLTHLTYKPDNDYVAVVDEVKKHFSGQVLVAKDLMEF
jgi:ribonuclease BN (tRNA processing enzyme)